MDYIFLEDIKDKLDFFSKMYDSVRLVDPVQKRVIDYRYSSLVETSEVCYSYWGTGAICDNCISVRSYMENKSYIKLEKTKNSVLLVTAIPIVHGDRPAVLELLKNATDTMLVGSGEYEKGKLLSKFADDINYVILRDPLTSLYNRRFLDERLPVDIVNASIIRIPISLCFIDLDNFKAINDKYGHETGDHVLRVVSEVILKNIHMSKAWAARYGGDEFVVFLCNVDENQAKLIAESIKNDVNEIPINKREGSPHISISYGISTMDKQVMTAEEMLRTADELMYKSKREKFL